MSKQINQFTKAELQAELDKLERPPKLKCDLCDSEFTPNKAWQKFCSKACQQKFHILNTRLKKKAMDIELEQLRNR